MENIFLKWERRFEPRKKLPWQQVMFSMEITPPRKVIFQHHIVSHKHTYFVMTTSETYKLLRVIVFLLCSTFFFTMKRLCDLRRIFSQFIFFHDDVVCLQSPKYKYKPIQKTVEITTKCGHGKSHFTCPNATRVTDFTNRLVQYVLCSCALSCCRCCWHFKIQEMLQISFQHSIQNHRPIKITNQISYFHWVPEQHHDEHKSSTQYLKYTLTTLLKDLQDKKRPK